MYTPTKWEMIKNAFRYWLCRHKHTEIRTVRGGSEGQEMKVLGRFEYCLDCRNDISGWLTPKQLKKKEE